MKKYLVFVISFVALYAVTQILSGLIMTAFYTPEIYPFIEQQTVYGTIAVPLLFTLLIAVSAYALTVKFEGKL